MIYGLFGCPRFGVKGAAYATVLGQCVSLFTAAFFHYTKNKEINNSIKYMKPSLRTIAEIQNYHISLNSGKIGIEKCAEIISSLY